MVIPGGRLVRGSRRFVVNLLCFPLPLPLTARREPGLVCLDLIWQRQRMPDRELFGVPFVSTARRIVAVAELHRWHFAGRRGIRLPAGRQDDLAQL